MSLDSPPVALNRFCKVEDPDLLLGTEAESLRLGLARRESNLRALGIVCYALSALWTYNHFQHIFLLFLHVTHHVFAPWIMEPYYFVVTALLALQAGLVLVAGYGLRRFRPWSQNVGLAYVLIYLFWSSMNLTADLWKGQPQDALAGLSQIVVLLIPFAILVRPEVRLVLSSEYAAAVEQTPYIRIRARLPLWIKLSMLLLGLIAIGLVVLLLPHYLATARPSPSS